MQTVLIAGPPRSGGTLVNSILCSDPDANPLLQENHFLARIAVVYEAEVRRLQVESDHYFESQKALQGLFRGFVIQYLAQLQSRHSVNRFIVIKSILFGPRIGLISDLIPTAKFIITVRDPRDIVASMLSVSEKQISNGVPAQYPRDMKVLCRIINDHYACLMRQDWMEAGNIFPVKYEDLVLQPGSVLPRLRKMTGINLGSCSVENGWQRSLRDFETARKDKAAYTSDLYGKPIQAGSVGKHREKLKKIECKSIALYCQALMDKLGYSY